ncbi:MAG: hypothetical protein CVU56_08365 [Deltaproteobacteria bacterium HGW-Deltaproteobacteria-14]|jgi:sirohydrochlorin ferrochelatase|nr:MAG: hypothetical protein CVU56_08365 [Deltaproteobacteria bacterium HGW-Deltaproteobacteria-14]
MSGTRPALVIAAHGSKSEGWAAAIHAFAAEVAETPGVRDAFAAVEAAFIESSAPRIPDAVRMALSSGCSEVVVVPLFLSVSAHVGEDLPGLLGLPVPEHVRRRLVAEGQQPLASGLAVRLIHVGALEDLLFRNILRRTSLARRYPAHEAVVLCAYGSALHHDAWEALMHTLRTRLMRWGFGYACHAWVGHVVGMSPEPTAQAVLEAGRMAGVQRVHVVPLLMAVGTLQTLTIAAAVGDAEKRGRLQVIYQSDAILPDGDLAARVGFRALEALGLFPSLGGSGAKA